MFFIISCGLHVLVGDKIATLADGDFLLVPPNTQHAFATPENTGVDMLFLMPRTKRFDYFRMCDRIIRGDGSPQEFLNTQDRFDNHFGDSAVWRDFRATTNTTDSPITEYKKGN